MGQAMEERFRLSIIIANITFIKGNIEYDMDLSSNVNACDEWPVEKERKAKSTFQRKDTARQEV